MLFNQSKKICGKQYGQYKIIKPLGEGRYGICYLAVTDCGEHVIIKRFKPSIFKKNMEKNANEAVILSQIDHPAIPKLLGVINQNDLYGFVLEQKPGHTVEHMLFKQKYSFKEMEIFNIGRQLIGIIKYLHGNGIVHRDIRVPNVLVHGSEVSLVDFGLARWADNKRYLYDHDFSYLGDFLLYLHYSSYKKKQRKSRPWYIELDLTVAQIQFFKRMLRLEKPYTSINEVEKDFISVFM